ncbi:MAG: hypothetical protein GEU79_12225 [Acidimicrobiia bacterium]|nr:hypothetical protein [Acidimicrobiia bacterium]
MARLIGLGSGAAMTVALLMGLTGLVAVADDTARADHESTDTLDVRDRGEVAASFENEVIQPIAAVPADPAWTGDLDPACNEGTIPPSLGQAALSQINWFRDMTGAAPLSRSAQLDNMASGAALLLAANIERVFDGDNPHNPPPTWDCYTEQRAEGAGRSNLAAGPSSLLAVDAIRLMNDHEDNNTRVAHRQWMLLPQVRPIGYGATNPSGDPATSSVVLIPENRTARTDEFIAWPTEGYIPMHVTPFRWSLAYHGSNGDADFSNANVTMTYQDAEVPVDVVHTGNAALGPQIVWDFTPGEVIPGPARGEKCDGHAFFCGGLYGEGLAVDATGGDVVVDVRVSGIELRGNTVDHCYRVVVFDPDRSGSAPPPFDIPCSDSPTPTTTTTTTMPQPPSGDCESSFSDTEGHLFEDDIACIADVGITLGCNPPENTLFCPNEDVTRGQMAAFIVRGLDLPDAPDQGFADTDGSVFKEDIDALAQADVTRGCNPPANDRFCPTEDVTRGQMAAFLVRGLDLPAASDQGFVDTEGSVFKEDIDALAQEGITRGCNPPQNNQFCPTEDVTRGQMAAFLNRALIQP